MKIVLQDGIKDCGICSLLSIIRFYGGDVSKEYLREITNTSKDGVSLFNLMIGAQKIGFDTKAVQGTIENIKVNNLPCIAHVIVNKSYHHFLVLYSINHQKEYVVLMDPAKGKKVISTSEFNLLSSGNYLFLKPIKVLPVMKSKNIIYKHLKTSFIIYKKQLFIILILTLSYFVYTLLTSFHFKYLMEYALFYNISNNIYYISILMLVCYWFKNINLLLRNMLLFKWMSLIDYSLSTIFYKKILLLPYLFYKNRTTGEVLSRFKDLNQIRTFYSSFFCYFTSDFLSIIVFCFMLFKIQKKLAIILISVSLLIPLITFFFKTKKEKSIKSIHKYEDTINSYLIQGINNVDTMKGSHLEKRFSDKFSLLYHSFVDTSYHYSRLMEVYQYLKSNITDFLNCILYGLGSFYVLKGNMSLGNFIIFQLFFSSYLNCLQRIISISNDYSLYKISLNRVEEMLMIDEENFNNHYYYLPYHLNTLISYKNLTYQIGSKRLFSNLNLNIYPGEKVLLCGESGSGKSTLLKMLLRYVDVEYGVIKIGDIDINHYHLENLRKYITYVSSNEYLFSDSIKNNICLYKDYSEEVLEKVCDICLVNECLESKGLEYDSLIEEDGFNFSNGERQRIILARALLRDSDIYIFDEALAQIDVYREKKILDNLFLFLKEKTIIVISHRFHNKKCFDKVYKLEGGTIINEKKL